MISISILLCNMLVTLPELHYIVKKKRKNTGKKSISLWESKNRPPSSVHDKEDLQKTKKKKGSLQLCATYMLSIGIL